MTGLRGFIIDNQLCIWFVTIGFKYKNETKKRNLTKEEILREMYRIALSCLIILSFYSIECFNIMDYSHYMDYLPYKQEGLSGLLSIIIIHQFIL